MFWTIPAGALVAAVASLAACAVAGGGVPTRTLALHPCHLDGLSEEVRCGTYLTYEDRRAGSGRQIPIQVAVLPAVRLGASPDPLVILAGGPGQGARSYAGLVARAFTRVRRTREIVLVDLRGTGDSQPLTCPSADDELSALAWTYGASEVQTCLSGLGADPRHYTHAEALADLDEIRQRLGYHRINLWGGSWGTRAALVYALDHPGATRAVILDGAVPLDMQFPLSASADAQRALDVLLADCAADGACAAAFPDLRADLTQLLSRLDAGPVVVTLHHPRTGAPSEMRITRHGFLEAVRTALYVPLFAAHVPMLIHEGARGDFAPLAAHVIQSAGALADDIALGATLSILCSEDLPRVATADFSHSAGASLFGSAYADVWRRRCATWPQGSPIHVDDHARAELPALILSGGADPVTPPRWGERMAAHFSRSRHFVLPGAAHNTSFSGCVPDLIAAFLERGSADDLDAGCVDRVTRPPFVVDRTGTRP